jgi:hypothetical protein
MRMNPLPTRIPSQPGASSRNVAGSAPVGASVAVLELCYFVVGFDYEYSHYF